MKQKILIVEDDQAVHKALKHLFESVGYAVEICRNPTSALEILRDRLSFHGKTFASRSNSSIFAADHCSQLVHESR